MTNRYYLTILLAAAALVAQAQLVISEIMYNPPESGTDSLEYVEIYNAGSAAVDLTDYTLTLSSNPSNPDTLSGTLAAGGFYVTAVNARAFESVFGRAPDAETGFGGLRNGGDRSLQLQDDQTLVIDEVTYQNSDPWPTAAAGDGPSIELCDAAADNDDGANWLASTTSTGVVINGQEVLGSPYAFPGGNCGTPTGPVSYPTRTIAEVIGTDANGQLDSIGATAELTGIVSTPDFRGGAGTEFFIQDASAGIRIAGDEDAYTPTIGDLIIVRGTVEQRSGIAQFAADSIAVVSANNPVMPVNVTTIDESRQGELVTLRNVRVVDSTEWQTSGSFNIEITDGNDTYTMRIDEDTDISGLEYPTGTFDVTGVATQFDGSSPFDEGYQILPRFAADFSPYVPGQGLVYPLYDIATITTEDADGVADSLGRRARVVGTVVGFDLNGTGLLFTVVDDNGDGIALYSPNQDFNYTAIEGDRVAAEGVVTQFNGLTQLEIVDLDFQSSGNPVPAPTVVTALGESTESRLVTLRDLTLLDPSQWRGDGSSFNVDFRTPAGDTVVIRIDNESPLSSVAAPDPGTYTITGIGGQFDRESPFDSGYQLFPRYIEDIDGLINTQPVAPRSLFAAASTPEGIRITPVGGALELYLTDLSGRVLAKAEGVRGETLLPLDGRRRLIVVTARDAAGRTASLQLLH